MKLVLKNDVDFKQAMSNKGGKKDLENNVSLLVLDERITSLTVEKLKDFNEPTLKKLEEIKNLSDKDFSQVISGLDKPYIDYKNEILETNDKVKLKTHYSKKPDGMSNEEFDNYVKGGVYTVVSMFSEVVKENKEISAKLELKIKELDDLNKRFQETVLGDPTFKMNSSATNSDTYMSEEEAA